MIQVGLIESLFFLFEKKSDDTIGHDIIKHDMIDTTCLI
jgi:hypothetical protein